MTKKPSVQPAISRFFSSQPKKAEPVEQEVIILEDEPNNKENTLAAFKYQRGVANEKVKKSKPTTRSNEPIKRLASSNEGTPKKRVRKSHFDDLTPLEQQFVTLKRKHPDKVLAIQVGYKFKFFGEDAAKVHKILSIMLVPGRISLDLDDPRDAGCDKIAYCSIPEPRLHIHLKRLLDRGLKVGVVEQTEVAAIKSQSANKSALFERKMTKVYTSGTYIEDDGLDTVFNKAGNFIIGLSESGNKISMVAVQLISGAIVYDSFEDDLSRNELETRLLHLDPTEFLIVDEISKESEKCLQDFKNSKKMSLRLSRVKSITYLMYLNQFDMFFEDMTFIMSFERDLQIVCFEMVTYLKEFNLQDVFSKTENFESFKTQKYMTLNNHTLRNLEVFQNSTNHELKGSLLWILDHTRTKFGFRLLKKWISQSLIDREEIVQRQDCVECLISFYNHRIIEMFTNFLKNCPDLVRSLNRIHLGKCSMKEIYLILQKFGELLEIIKNYDETELDHFNGPLKELFMIFKDCGKELVDFELYLGMINSHVIKDDRMEVRQQKMQYFNSKFFNYSDLQVQIDRISEIKEELKEELLRIRKFLKRPLMEYVKNNKEEYLIEVRNSEVAKIPSDWLKFNSTKTVSRFFTPEVTKLIERFKYCEEVLISKTESNFKVFLVKIDSFYSQLNKIVKNLAQLDCLLSLASVSVDYVRPKMMDTPYIELVESRNPILDMLNPGEATICNNIRMSQEEERVLIITGPNMGGKSSLIKQIAITVIMAQIGCFIPARVGCLGVFTKIFIRMGSQDNILKGESTFQVEMSECLNILEQMDDRSLVLLDEIGRGTSTNDGFAIAFAILNYLITESKSFVLFITHFNKLINFEHNFKNVKNYHMNYLINGTDLTFLYKFIRGGCSKSYGINVARLTSIPEDVVENAQRISKEYEESLGLKMAKAWSYQARDLLRMLATDEDNKHDITSLLDRLLENI